MIFLSRDFDKGWTLAQDEFEEHFISLGGPEAMMMIAQRINKLGTRIYLLLPDGSQTLRYDGFTEVNEIDLPQEASLLVGHQDQFLKRFRFATRF